MSHHDLTADMLTEWLDGLEDGPVATGALGRTWVKIRGIFWAPGDERSASAHVVTDDLTLPWSRGAVDALPLGTIVVTHGLASDGIGRYFRYLPEWWGSLGGRAESATHNELVDHLCAPAPVADEPEGLREVLTRALNLDPAPVADPPTDNLATHPGDGTSCVNCGTPIVLRPEGGWTHTSRTWNGAVCPPRFTNPTPAPVADGPTMTTDPTADEIRRALDAASDDEGFIRTSWEELVGIIGYHRSTDATPDLGAPVADEPDPRPCEDCGQVVRWGGRFFLHGNGRRDCPAPVADPPAVVDAAAILGPEDDARLTELLTAAGIGTPPAPVADPPTGGTTITDLLDDMETGPTDPRVIKLFRILDARTRED